jgi:hypothetical protein
VPCTESRSSIFTPWRRRLGLIGIGVVAGCSSPGPAPENTPPAATAGRTNVVTAPVKTVSTRSSSGVKLQPPGAVRNWNEVRRQAAQRIMAANPNLVYSGAVPDPLLAIPVLEVELNGDGSIRRIDVLRHPRQAKDTTQIAIQAIHNAAPFGDVSRLPKPWRFTETFLFDEDRKFKPRSLD